ncbi:MAG TPA: hypothetical protein EYP58_03255 [bacterium (Candidatus Stahlbacteria)]|nr:hypothetical protein [Candidatus Stahlbacteria bacterium]
MRRVYLFVLIFGLGALSCLNPTHDNAYDPENPNKARLFGKVWFTNIGTIPGANVALLFEGEVKEETQTGSDGLYEFRDIDPSIYLVSAYTGYFIPETVPVPLPADTENLTDIYLDEILVDFERDPLGTPEPWLFRILSGDWSIRNDPAQGHVYHGIAPSPEPSSAMFDMVLKDFYYETMVRVDTSSSSSFAAGIYFRYHDDYNHYGLIFYVDHIKLFKIVNNNWDLIKEDWRPFPPGAWITLGVAVKDDHIQVFLNHAPLFNEFDSAFSDGHVGLFVEHAAAASFDDVYIDVSGE